MFSALTYVKSGIEKKSAKKSRFLIKQIFGEEIIFGDVQTYYF